MSQDGLSSGIHQSRRSRAAGVRGDECPASVVHDFAAAPGQPEDHRFAALTGDTGAGHTRLRVPGNRCYLSRLVVGRVSQR